MPHDSPQSGQGPAAQLIASRDFEPGPAFDPAAGRQLADDQLVVLHEVAKCLAQDRGLAATLAVIADKGCFLTSSTSTAVCLLDEEREMLDFAAVAGRGAAEMTGQRVRVMDALPGQTALSGEPVLAFNPSDHGSALGKNRVGAAFDDPVVLSGGVRSAAVVPIVVGSSSVGSVAAINRLDGQSFTGSDLLMLQILAASASTAIQKDFLGRQAAQRERERNILFRVARTTASSLDVQNILEGALENLSYGFDVAAAMVYLLNDDRTHLYIAAQRGLSQEECEVQLFAEGPLAAGALQGGGRAYIVDEPHADPRFEDIIAPDPAPIECMMVVPLAARDSPSGLIVLVSRRRGAYARDDLALAAAVSAQTAIAIENAWLYEDATRRAEEATAIYELSQAINTSLNLQKVLNFVADSVVALLQVDKFALFLHDRERNCLEIKVARNLSRDAVRSMRPAPDQRGIAWWVFEYETPAAVRDVAADHRNRSCPIDQEAVASLVSVPVQSGEDALGVIHAMSSRRRSFTVAEMELLYTIANQVGVAISNIRTLEETRQKTAELRRSFRRVSRALGASADPGGTASAITDLAAEMMAVDHAILYTIARDCAPPRVFIQAAHGLRLPRAVQDADCVSAAGKEASAAWIARRGRSLRIETPGADPRFVPADVLVPYVGRAGSYLGVPLKIGSATVAVLEVYSREPRAFPAEEMRRLLTFAAQAAVALQNALLVEDVARRRQDVETIASIARALRRTSDDGPTVLARCLEILVTALPADAALLMGGERLGVKRKGLFVGAGRALPMSAADEEQRDVLRWVSARMNANKRLEYVWPGPVGDAWDVPGGAAPRPIAAFGLVARAGALCVARLPGQPAFAAGDQRLIQTVASLVGILA